MPFGTDTLKQVEMTNWEKGHYINYKSATYDDATY